MATSKETARSLVEGLREVRLFAVADGLPAPKKK